MKKTPTEIQKALLSMGMQVKPSPEFKYATKAKISGTLQPKVNYYPKFAGAFLGIGIFLISGAGTVLAAQYSLPDDKLYPVKILSEKLVISAAPKALKPSIEDLISKRREDEVYIVKNKNKTDREKGIDMESDKSEKIPEKIIDEKLPSKTEDIQNIIKDAPNEIIQVLDSEKEETLDEPGSIIKSNPIIHTTVTK